MLKRFLLVAAVLSCVAIDLPETQDRSTAITRRRTPSRDSCSLKTGTMIESVWSATDEQSWGGIVRAENPTRTRGGAQVPRNSVSRVSSVAFEPDGEDRRYASMARVPESIDLGGTPG